MKNRHQQDNEENPPCATCGKPLPYPALAGCECGPCRTLRTKISDPDWDPKRPTIIPPPGVSL